MSSGMHYTEQTLFSIKEKYHHLARYVLPIHDVPRKIGIITKI